MKKHLTVRVQQTIFWLMALSWTILIIIVLLKPGSNTINQERELSSFSTAFFSLSISRRDIKEAVGHIIMFAVLTILWMRLLIIYLAPSRVTLLAVGLAVVLAIGTEIGQYFVDRGSLMLDLLANFAGILIAYLAYSYLRKLKIRYTRQ